MNQPEKCITNVVVKVTETQNRNYQLAANSKAAGNKSRWVKQTLDRAAQRLRRR